MSLNISSIPSHEVTVNDHIISEPNEDCLVATRPYDNTILFGTATALNVLNTAFSWNNKLMRIVFLFQLAVFLPLTIRRFYADRNSALRGRVEPHIFQPKYLSATFAILAIVSIASATALTRTYFAIASVVEGGAAVYFGIRAHQIAQENQT